MPELTNNNTHLTSFLVFGILILASSESKKKKKGILILAIWHLWDRKFLDISGVWINSTHSLVDLTMNLISELHNQWQSQNFSLEGARSKDNNNIKKTLKLLIDINKKIINKQ